MLWFSLMSWQTPSDVELTSFTPWSLYRIQDIRECRRCHLRYQKLWESDYSAADNSNLTSQDYQNYVNPQYEVGYDPPPPMTLEQTNPMLETRRSFCSLQPPPISNHCQNEPESMRVRDSVMRNNQTQIYDRSASSFIETNFLSFY